MPDIDQLRSELQALRSSFEALPVVEPKPKTTLQVLGRGRREQHWNALLRYFLDPGEPHGVGADLLRRLFERIPEENPPSIPRSVHDEIEVRSEVGSGRGNRADIIAWLEGEWFLWCELKVGSAEGQRQTVSYADAAKFGDHVKDDFDRGIYLYIARPGHTSDADEFVDMTWVDVVEAIDHVLSRSAGRITERGASQLRDFRDTINRVTDVEQDEARAIRRQKAQLYTQHHDVIEELEEAFDHEWGEIKDEWHETFIQDFRPDVWDEEWHCHESEGGHIYYDHWWRDEDYEPADELRDFKYGINFQHPLHTSAAKSRILNGKLRFRTVTFSRDDGGNDDYRNSVKRLFNNEFQQRLREICEEHGIQPKSGKKTHTDKTYSYDATDGFEGYYRTLKQAVEEHADLTDLITEIHEKALQTTKNST